MSAKKLIIASVFIAALIITSSFLYSTPGYAVGPFAGYITAINFCWCTGNIAVFVAGPNGGVYIYQPGVTQLFAYGQVFRPGPAIKGMSGGIGVCRFGTCTLDPIVITGPMMLTAGTSL